MIYYTRDEVLDNIENNFLDLNKEFEFVEGFARVINKYGRPLAGKIFNAFWLIHHPESKLFSATLENKIDWIEKGYLTDLPPEFDWESPIISGALNSFADIMMSDAARLYFHAKMLYESAMSQSIGLDAENKAKAIKAISGSMKILEDAKAKYMESKVSEKRGKSAGEIQSGGISSMA